MGMGPLVRQRGGRRTTTHSGCWQKGMKGRHSARKEGECSGVGVQGHKSRLCRPTLGPLVRQGGCSGGKTKGREVRMTKNREVLVAVVGACPILIAVSHSCSISRMWAHAEVRGGREG